MNIDLKKIYYTFSTKPLLIGGCAKEYYGIRKAGEDIDFVVTEKDYENLAKMYPDNLADLYGDLGIKIHGFEIWKSICLYDYDYLATEAENHDSYKIISLEKLLFLTALGIKEVKYQKDLELIVAKILELRYKKIK